MVDYYERAAQEVGVLPREMPSTHSQMAYRRFNDKSGDGPSPNRDVQPLKTGKATVPGFDTSLNQSAALNAILYSGAPGFTTPAVAGITKKGKKAVPPPPHCTNVPPPPALFYS